MILCSLLIKLYTALTTLLEDIYVFIILNLLTPNVNYSGRTASLTSKVSFYIFIQQI